MGSVYRPTLQHETDDIRRSVDIAEVGKAMARKGGQFVILTETTCRYQWPRGLMQGYAAARILRLRVRIPPVAWMSVYCECRVL
jgi:hypothetical protein